MASDSMNGPNIKNIKIDSFFNNEKSSYLPNFLGLLLCLFHVAGSLLGTTEGTKEMDLGFLLGTTEGTEENGSLLGTTEGTKEMDFRFLLGTTEGTEEKEMDLGLVV
jgi:hypothetical protein